MSDLQKVPGIGAKKEAELIALGYPTLEALKDADPEDLYLRASVNEGQTLDKCVLYAFRCAVAYANDPAPDDAKYRWWYFSDKDKK